MLSIVIPSLVIVICLVVVSLKYWNRLYDYCLTTLIILLLYGFFTILLGTKGYFESRAFVSGFKAVEKTVKKASYVGEIISIAEANSKLAKWKYYNSVYFFDPWVTDEVDDLKPIE